MPLFHFHSFWLTMALSPFSLWVIAIIVMFTSRESHPKRIGSEVRYVKPVQWSVFGILMSVSFLWVSIWASFPPVWPIYFFCGLGIWLFMLIGSPSEVRINLDAKTYWMTAGWPCLRKQWAGPLQDVSRLTITHTKGRTLVTLHLKQLKRWKAQPPGLTLGNFSSRQQAEAAALSVMEEWAINVPITGIGARVEWLRKK